jgi:hypothetical protein
MTGTTFTTSHTSYIVTAATEPMSHLAGEYARCGWTHLIAARRPAGRKEYMFHARVEGGRVVMTSGAF